ncbi:MAG: pyridoxamine 5'-phosphate oxidase family protein [Rhodospirillaceae bacterium]|nr:pyridoxamine 5'-phosphate oxidase family protein [Rhodospirillaceae bacterium]
MPDGYSPTPRAKIKRSHKRARYDKATVFEILDAAQMVHVGYAIDEQPYVTPTMHWRDGDTLYWHGSSASKMLRAVRTGIPACVTAAIFDGYVLARSPFHHSANYRTVMAFGRAQAVEGRQAKEDALYKFMEELWPGRWDACRENYTQEMKATCVVVMEIEEAAAKIRTGPPVDDEEDYANVKVWSGVVPALHKYGKPVADDRLDPDTPLPDYLSPYRGR